MKCFRQTCLLLVLACSYTVSLATAQNQPPRPPNPFENVPQQPTAPAPPPQQQPPSTPGQPRLEAPAAPQLPQHIEGQTVEAVEFRGSRRVPQDTLRAMIATRAGDLYSEDVLRRDFMTLWNSARFDDLRLEVENGRSGLIVRFIVTERRVIRTINYEGNKSITVSEIMDRLKERKVGLSVEQPYDPAKIQRAAIVIKEYLGERGHEYATVEPVIEQMPPASLKVTFKCVEGPKVKVGEIYITGNNAFNKRWIISHMKALKPIGIPKSIILESIFAKTYDQNKLEYDLEMIRQAYMNNGYMQARIHQDSVDIVRRGGSGWRLPLIRMNSPRIVADIRMRVDEGRQYKVGDITFQGIKLFRAPEALMKPLFGMGQGDIFSSDKLKKGLEQMQKLYGRWGYIDFVAEPDLQPVANTDKMDLTLTADEGKQFFIRRIDFSGNTTTRDKVIRREFLLDEGDYLNMDFLELSILRLNQLGYFEMLKKEDAADIKRNPQSNTVDLTLKVKERGKNSIGLNGGASGIAGSFVGFNYSTNNFLGLGETLSLESQLGTRTQDVRIGFTEPYLFDRPIQAGFMVYMSRFAYDQGREASILAGADYRPLYQQLGTENQLNYTQRSKGFTVSLSTHLKRSFAQIGITYGYDYSTIHTDTTAASNYFRYLNFSGVSGPNSLSGIRTSHIAPSYSYNTVNHPITPTAGRSIYASVDFAGSILGGNVNTIRPALDVKYFKVAPWSKTHVLAFHASASLLTGYGGKVAPPYSRSFIGGEMDVRGFESWAISPMAYIPTTAAVPALNADGSARTQKSYNSAGQATQSPQFSPVPAYQLITPGGDTQIIGNFEYRIPIITNVVTLAPFADIGLNKILLRNQLRLEANYVSGLNEKFPQADFENRVRIVPGTQKPRASLGMELQVMLPIVQAPFRIYWAYNPTVVRQNLQPPIVVDQSSFPNYATYANAVTSFGVGRATGWFEKRSTFRFTIGKTF